MDLRPIGVFDSGLGGLTAVRRLMDCLPAEDIVYFGDTGRVPYGSRGASVIASYAAQDCRFLLSQDVKLIIAACGTVSSVAAQVLKTLPVPAIGVVEPTAEKAAAVTRSGKIGIIGTASTIHSGAYERQLRQLLPGAQLFSEPCPLLVSLVENGWIEADNEVTRLTVRRYLAPLREAGIDTLILGCTHFPLLVPFLREYLGDGVTLVDSGREAAERCAEILRRRDLLNLSRKRAEARFYVSDRPQDFARTAQMFLGLDVADKMHLVDIEKV